MKLRHLLWILGPLAVGGIVYLARSGTLTPRVFRTDPVLVCPNSLELGERELGEVALVRFTIANHGGADLVIDDVLSNCACSGLEREKDGKFIRVESLRLKPSEQAELVMRVLVQGRPGASTQSAVSFRSNDPRQPHKSIEASVARVKAGVTSVPTSVVFGTLSIGAKATQLVDVFDSAAQARAIEKVESLNSERIAVRLLPHHEMPPRTGPSELGARIACLEVTALTNEAGPLTGGIDVHLAAERRAPSVIAVSGRVAAPVEISPTVLLLPRSSSAGPLYFGECTCRSDSGKAFALSVESAPPDVKVQLSAHASGTDQTVRVEWVPTNKVDLKPTARRYLRLRADIDGQATTLEVPILCVQKGKS